MSRRRKRIGNIGGMKSNSSNQKPSSTYRGCCDGKFTDCQDPFKFHGMKSLQFFTHDSDCSNFSQNDVAKICNPCWHFAQVRNRELFPDSKTKEKTADTDIRHSKNTWRSLVNEF